MEKSEVHPYVAYWAAEEKSKLLATDIKDGDYVANLVIAGCTPIRLPDLKGKIRYAVPPDGYDENFPGTIVKRVEDSESGIPTFSKDGETFSSTIVELTKREAKLLEHKIEIGKWARERFLQEPYQPISD